MPSPIQSNEIVAALKADAREKGIPLFGTFELTGRCNLDCKMCFVHVMDHKAALKKELSTDSWKKIMDEAFESGMLFALLTGGECLIRPDFKELYTHLYDKGVIMSVNTNGVMLNRDMAEFFAAHQPEWVQISLYGSNDDAYEYVTGSREFKRVEQAIALLEEYGISCRLAITPSKFMLPDFEALMRYVIEKDIPYHFSEELIEAREGLEREDYFLSEEERLSLFKTMRKIRGRKVTPPQDKAPPEGGTCSQCPEGMPCNAGTTRFNITWEGNMLSCMSIQNVIVEDVLGNGFQASWDKLRSIMAKAKQPAKCIGCFYEKYCNSCPGVRYDGIFSGKCKQSLCNYMKKKYEAGLLRLPKK